MRKKGFTLIELLAVIVLLAIVMLVSSPIVLNIINNSKNKATLRSAEMYVKALENSLGNIMLDEIQIEDGTYSIMKDGNLCLELNNDSCTKGLLKVEISGEVPKSGTVILEKGQVKYVKLELNNKTITQNNEGKLVYQTKEDSNIVFDGDITFTYNEEEYWYDLSECINKAKIKNNSKYRITISDVNNSDKVYEVTSSFGKIYYYNEEEFMLDGFSLGDKNDGGYAHLYDPNICYFSLWDEELNLEGKHHVKVEYLEDETYSHILRVSDSSIYIFSTELVEGDAIIEVKDSDGVVTNFNVIVESDSAYRYINIDDYDYKDNHSISQLFNKYYQTLKEEKNITITIKQGDNTYILGGEKFTYAEADDYCFEEHYYWGNNKLGYLFGC